jgi:O-antigen ligase
VLRPLLVTAVPLGALAALAGAYPSATLPLLVASAAVFVLSGAADLATQANRRLDFWLMAFLAAILLQFVTLPSPVVAAISPRTGRLQSILSIDIGQRLQSMTIDAGLTRMGFASALSAVLVFWSARGVFARGGLRIVGRVMAIAAALAGLVGLAQRVTSPKLLLWTWRPIDPGALPYGPFVNRNHFAAWLLMAAALTLGYIAARVRSHRLLGHKSWRARIHDVIADGTTLILCGCAAAITLALISSGSRGALIGTGAALVAAFALARRKRLSHASLTFGIATAALLVVWGVIANVDLLAHRFTPGHEVSRATIWQETLPVIRDFPAAGTGIGTYARAMLVYQQTKSELLFNQAHNEYLQLLSEGGLLVAIPAAGALIAWVVLAWRRVRDDRRELVWMRVGAASGLCGIAVQCLWESPLRMPANAMLFALLAAVVVHDPQARGSRGSSGPDGSTTPRTA